MYKIILTLTVLFFITEGIAKEMKVLMIGNSFSICVGNNLPQIVKAGKKHHLILTSAYIGGCSLETHAKHLVQAEKDPDFKPYRINVWDSDDLRTGKSRKGNVFELLKNNKYDVITIQQASHFSWNYNTYQPHADTVIAYIRKLNPQAKILIQQTWAYRSDDARLTPKGWGFDQQGMHEKVRAAYHQLAKDKGFAVIPTGDAIAHWRKNHKPVYKPLSEKELAKFRSPDLPPMADDIVGRDYWSKQKDGTLKLGADRIHLNFKGEYLQACVWYGFLFDEDPATIKYEHPKISSEECRILAASAKAALGR